MKIEDAYHLIQKTKKDYDILAEKFSLTREKFWPEIYLLKNYIKEEDKILDLGCGNGRLYNFLKDRKIYYFGVDQSSRMISLAKKKFPDAYFIVSNVLKVPFQENFFDKVFSLAVFHHIPSKTLRLEFLKEAKRILKPKGILFLTVWNLFQEEFLKYHLKTIFLKILGKTKLDFKDIFYPFKDSQGKILALRYFHAFTFNELKSLIKKAGLKIEKIQFLPHGRREKANILIIIQKP